MLPLAFLLAIQLGFSSGCGSQTDGKFRYQLSVYGHDAKSGLEFPTVDGGTKIFFAGNYYSDLPPSGYLIQVAGLDVAPEAVKVLRAFLAKDVDSLFLMEPKSFPLKLALERELTGLPYDVRIEKDYDVINSPSSRRAVECHGQVLGIFATLTTVTETLVVDLFDGMEKVATLKARLGSKKLPEIWTGYGAKTKHFTAAEACPKAR